MNIFYKHRGFIAVLLLLASGILHGKTPSLKNGILDLTTFQPPLKNISLSGEWEFYWKQLIPPDDFFGDLPEPALCKVPDYWTSYDDAIPGVTGLGYGTYRLRVLLPHGSRESLSLDIPVIDCAYNMFINGNGVAGSGQVGTSKETSFPGYKPELLTFWNQSDTLDIVIHVSNYSHRRGGIWLDLKLGETEHMVKLYEQWRLIYSALIGILFVTVVFFFILFFYFRSNREFLFFSLATMGILFRLMNTGIYPGFYFLNQAWDWTIRLEYLGTIAAIGFGGFYFNALYPSGLVQKITRYVGILFTILGFGVMVLSPLQFSYSVYIIQATGILLLVYYFIRSLPGVISRRTTDIMFFISIIIFLAAAINDTLVSYSSSPLKLDYLLPIAFLIFVELQIFLAVRQWIITYREKLVMDQELKQINLNLEKQVESRTRDLERSNTELKETLNIRNRMFSIIAHDLKSPVASLAQQSDYLKNKYKGTEDETFISEINRLSHASVHLINNLLVWGRKQENKIQYDPTFVSPSEIVDEILPLLEASLEKKQLEVTRQIDPARTIYCDPSLLRIILHNLLTNAVKFSRENGEILLTAKQVDEMVEIGIHDNGVGMEPEKIEPIMSNSAVSTVGTAGERGTGLGLSLVRELVEINKGSLRIESKPGKGTVVMLSLPGKP